MDFPKFFEQMFKNIAAGASARAVFPAQLPRVRRLEQGGPALHVLPADGLEHVLAPCLHAVLQAAAQLLQGRVDIADSKPAPRAWASRNFSSRCSLAQKPKSKMTLTPWASSRLPTCHINASTLSWRWLWSSCSWGAWKSSPKRNRCHSSGVNRMAPVSRSSSLARVVFPEPGRPTIKNSVACPMALPSFGAIIGDGGRFVNDPGKNHVDKTHRPCYPILRTRKGVKGC